MNQAEIEANATLLILASSEITATLLSGLIFLLLSYPISLANVQQDIRTAFSTPAGMTFAAEAELVYADACIKEALRMYPPAPSAIHSLEGNAICGRWGPGNVCSALSLAKDTPDH